MNKKRVLIALLSTGGLFFVLFLGWQKLAQRYSTNKAPEAFHVLGFLENNPFHALKGVEVFDLAEKPVNIAEYGKGKFIIVNFWASWCEPCAEEFPSMLKLLAQYRQDLIPRSERSEKRHRDLQCAFGLEAILTSYPVGQKEASKSFRSISLEFIFDRNGKLIRKECRHTRLGERRRHVVF